MVQYAQVLIAHFERSRAAVTRQKGHTMAARTYQATLRRLLTRIATYCTKHDTQLRQFMTSEQQSAYTTFLSGLTGFRTALGPEPTSE